MGKASSTGNTSQKHGNEFEDQIRVSRLFSGTIRVEANGQGAFDIPASCDKAFHLATSVKTAGGDWIGLADAERFCRIDRPWRLIYSQWEQKRDGDDEYKSYAEVHEMIIPLSVMRKIVGDLTPEMVLAWHIEIASYVPGPEAAAAARVRAKEIKKSIDGKHGLLRLDFKIDDKDQRRLQFSIRISVIAKLLQGLGHYRTGRNEQSHHVVHRKWFHQHRLPIDLRSPPRRIEREAAVCDPVAILFDDTIELAPASQPADENDVFAIPSTLTGAPPLRLEERNRKQQGKAETMHQATLL